nr:sugar phosphate nucleotidyltransferase [Wenzhouxiangella sp. XN24]
MAGGRGSRLQALTRTRAKPVVSFGGEYRIIDYTLSNCFNSGIRRVGVLTQYEAHELIAHLQRVWALRALHPGAFVEAWPAQQGEANGWYRGTADAVRQNLPAIQRSGASHVLVLGGDHVYNMDYRDLLAGHVARHADVTVACTEVGLPEASRCGVLQTDAAGRVIAFAEKPRHLESTPDRPDRAHVSMGIYLFRVEALVAGLNARGGSLDDFGGDVVPWMIKRHRVFAHPFVDKDGAPRFWRDVGTVKAYFEANMALLDPAVRHELCRPEWPLITDRGHAPPAVLESDASGCEAMVLNSLLACGARISGAHVNRSIVSRDVTIGSGSIVEDTVLLPGAVVGADCRLHQAVVDENCHVPDGTIIEWRGGGSAMEGAPVLVTRESLRGEVTPRLRLVESN